ncbi:hypothetical protein [Kribbella italica]|uniref:Uncharacterized protein n=1 Tax=Kribbella italica TaxID=1540520 RepID=A0A7W9MTJ4_9ACTN|nr:hypothetical protein [Kribbella italica]MBB5835861.1 hypothetical protein [Kribbella italica]
MVIECTGDDPGATFSTAYARMRSPGRSSPGRVERIARETAVDPTFDGELRGLADSGIEQLAAFVREVHGPPGWSYPDAGFADTSNYLTVLLRIGRLIAVHADPLVVDRLQRWLDKAPRPAARRVPPEVLETALLQGASKGLWLRNTHRRRATKPDTKTISGLSLRDALSPFEDAGYAMGSARALLDDDPDRTALQGTVGTTPRKSSVWLKASTDFVSFAAAVGELLSLLEQELAAGVSFGHGLPHLARAVDDLTGVFGAYEVRTPPPEDLPDLPGIGEELIAAAEILEDSVIGVHGKDNSADLVVDVGFGGSISGAFAIVPKPADDGFQLSVGYADRPNNPSDPQVACQIMDALEHTELLTIYYRSGHTFTDGRIWRDQVPVAPFGNWAFEDFTTFALDREKPIRPQDGRRSATPQEIHDLIGRPEDQSLFGWVVRHFGAGWLTCDDGSGEAADFFHISPGGTLSAIHVKGAHSASPRRRVAASAYEVVVGQAVKNLSFNDVERLRSRLHRAPVGRPACWTDSTRTPDRSDFLEALELRNATDDHRVVVVQPHLSYATYQRLRADSVPTDSPDLFRLHLVENMLNSARASAVGIGSDLVVIGSLV